jgi:hypothetical protein
MYIAILGFLIKKRIMSVAFLLSCLRVSYMTDRNRAEGCACSAVLLH